MFSKAMKMLLPLRLPPPLAMLAAGFVSLPLVGAETVSSSSPQSLLAFIGTYTGPKSDGIYVARFDPTTGRLGTPELAAKTVNPTFLALHPNQRFLYAVGETGSDDGKQQGTASGFSIAPGTGKLTRLNQQPSGGGGPCHLAVNQTGKCLLTANYGSGSVALLPLQPSGLLGTPSATIQHHGFERGPSASEWSSCPFHHPLPGQSHGARLRSRP